MVIVTRPQEMNATFVELVNNRDVAGLLSLYEPGAVLRTGNESTYTGTDEIEQALANLLKVPGRFVGRNNFWLESGDLALLRADYYIEGEDGTRPLTGGTCEFIRRGADGGWRYVIDHAAGASVPSVL